MMMQCNVDFSITSTHCHSEIWYWYIWPLLNWNYWWLSTVRPPQMHTQTTTACKTNHSNSLARTSDRTTFLNWNGMQFNGGILLPFFFFFFKIMKITICFTTKRREKKKKRRKKLDATLFFGLVSSIAAGFFLLI